MLKSSMITIFQAVTLGLAQGLTELFPISSLGHSVIIPALFGWNIDRGNSFFLTYLVATHFATALVLLFFFLGDWVQVAKGLWRSIINRRIDQQDTYAKMGWLLVAGTIPAGLIGLLFQKPLEHLFASAQIAAVFLFINGIILLIAERLRKNNRTQTRRAVQSDRNIARLSWSQAIAVGTAQTAALLPGISRSGSSMAGGLMVGLNNEDAARFSFLLATPIIGAAALLKLPAVFSPSYSSIRGVMFIGALCAALSAYVSIRFLMKFFQTNTLKPFAIYCLIAGVASGIYLLVR